MSDLTDLVHDDQFLLQGVLCGPYTPYPSKADGSGFDFFPAPTANQNDSPNPSGGVTPGFDSAGGRLLQLDGEFYVEFPTTVMDLRKGIGPAFRASRFTQRFDFRHQGQVYSYFGRPRQVAATPASDAWAWAGEFMATWPNYYGPELGPFTVGDTDFTVAAAPDSVPSVQWSMVVVAGGSNCVNPIVEYRSMVEGVEVDQIVRYPTLLAGHTLTVSGRYEDAPRAVITDGSGNVTPTLGFDYADGNPHQVKACTTGTRHFKFLSDSGVSTATVNLRDEFD